MRYQPRILVLMQCLSNCNVDQVVLIITDSDEREKFVIKLLDQFICAVFVFLQNDQYCLEKSYGYQQLRFK